MKFFTPEIILILIFLFSCRKSNYYLEDEIVISDLGGGAGTVTWTSDKSYLINGFVFVNDGQTLTIEAGTVVRAKTGQGSQASALIVARGGTILAEGSPDKPIIFTVEGDDLIGSIPLKARGLWGGLIILGNARINSPTGEGFIEGIPISEPRGIYGGYYDEDNSGILKYVSIRHGGTNIGEDNEINGLTLGGVGKKTIISHVEIISNSDDGLEIFGGTANLTNIAVAFCGDDAFDFDEGYRGKCQFLLGIMDDEAGDQVVEHTGDPYSSSPAFYTLPEVYNSTFIGHPEGADSYLISFEKGSGGIYRNCIFLKNETGISIEYTGGNDSYSKVWTRQLDFSNNIFFQISGNNSDSLFVLYPASMEILDKQAELNDSFQSKSNIFEETGISVNNIPYDLLPVSTVFPDLAEYSSSWYERVTYKGGFGSRNWLEGWSLLWEEGIVR